VIACIWLAQWAGEFAYFLGLPGSGAALLTPDLRAAWYSYDFIRYFFEHGFLVIAAVVLVFGRILPLRPGAGIRGHSMFFCYLMLLIAFNAIFKTNYMYLRHKPTNSTALDYLGPWPIYIFVGEAIAILLFWLLWQLGKPKSASKPELA
jgi:hypothetical integral membrane protein (TIGR02206 family)